MTGPSQARQVGLDNRFEQTRKEARAAERAGFDAIFLPELHQVREGAIVSPLIVPESLGSRGTTTRLGTLVVSGPLRPASGVDYFGGEIW